MEKTTGICPGCRRKCDLATPRCHVGEAYAKTGMLPGDKKKGKKDHPKDAPLNTVDAEFEQQQGAASGDGRLADTLRAVSRALRHGEGTLDALSTEEKELLSALIEKAWAGMESGRDGHRGHHDHHGHHGPHGHGDEALCVGKGKKGH